MSPRRSRSLIRDVTLMYSLELFPDTNGYTFELHHLQTCGVFFIATRVLYNRGVIVAVGHALRRILQRFVE